jgi:hypothetical protein
MNEIVLQFEVEVVMLRIRELLRGNNNNNLFRASCQGRRSRDGGTLACSGRRHTRNGCCDLPQRSKPPHHPTNNARQRSVDTIARKQKQQSDLGKPKALLWVRRSGTFSSTRRIWSQTKTCQARWRTQTNTSAICSGRTGLRRTQSRRFHCRVNGSVEKTFNGKREIGRSRSHEVHSWSVDKYNCFDFRCQRSYNSKRLDVCPSVASQGIVLQVWDERVTLWGRVA